MSSRTKTRGHPEPNDVTCWDWDDKRGPTRLRTEIDRSGVAWFHAPELVASVDQPKRLLRRLLGPNNSIARVMVDDIKQQKDARSYSGTNDEALVHTDNALALPPQIQVMACLRQGSTGGESVFADTWPLLRRIRREEPQLFRSLYTRLRAHQSVNGVVFRPTVAWRYGTLVVTHASSPFDWDELGAAFLTWLDSTPRIEFRARPGDIFVANNHRLVHGRRRFTGRRLFKRILAWPSQIFAAPADLTAPAKLVSSRLRTSCAGQPSWLSETLSPRSDSTLGLRRLAIVMSYFDGESLTQLGARHGIAPMEIQYWAESALRAFAQVLGDLPTQNRMNRTLLRLWKRLPGNAQP